MVVWGAIRAWWHARQRRIDIDVLWPICLKGANDLGHARNAFLVHCFHDPAWLALGEKELMRRIDRLTYDAYRDLRSD
jgi:hypothetical protein